MWSPETYRETFRKCNFGLPVKVANTTKKIWQGSSTNRQVFGVNLNQVKNHISIGLAQKFSQVLPIIFIYNIAYLTEKNKCLRL
jgi:hypothetical protein